MKKLYVTREEYIFVSAQMLHVLHMSYALYLPSGWFIILVSVVPFTEIWIYTYAAFQGYEQWSIFFSMIHIRTKD